MKEPSTLPIDLSSYRFLGGGRNERDYLLFSELLELNADQEQNVIKFKVETQEPFVRLYLEDNSIQAKLTCLDRDKIEIVSQHM